MNKPQITLYDSVGLGIIIEYPTGIMISNQTGGTSCLHPEIEGVFLPMMNDYLVETKEFVSPEIALDKYFFAKYNGTGATNGLDKDDINFLERFFIEHRLDYIKIDNTKISNSHEAWIYIIVSNNNNELMNNFAEKEYSGVLTWSNSD